MFNFLLRKVFETYTFITQSYLFMAFESIFTRSLKHISCIPKKPQ